MPSERGWGKDDPRPGLHDAVAAGEESKTPGFVLGPGLASLLGAPPAPVPEGLDAHLRHDRMGRAAMKTWTKPEATEIKMDAEISSYQDDSYDPVKDGPLFIKSEQPAETNGEPAVLRA